MPTPPPILQWRRYSSAGPLLPSTRYLPAFNAGIKLGLFPSDPMYQVQLYRSTQSSTGAGSSSKWGFVQTVPLTDSNEIVVNDLLPLSTQTYYYRARQTHDNWTPGPWTTVVSGKPTRISQFQYQRQAFGSTALSNIVGQPQTNTGSRYRCDITQSGFQSVSNSSLVNLTFDVENADVGNLHDNAVNNSRVTVTATNNLGAWLLVANVLFATNATGYRELSILKNGGTVNQMRRTAVSGLAGEILVMSEAVLDPSPGDYFQVQVLQTSGGNLNVFGHFKVLHLW